MSTHLVRAAAIALAGFAACGAAVRAEVSAEVDGSGNYVRMIVTSTSAALNTRVWTVVKSRPGVRPLNREGDLNGDLWPAIGETEGPGRIPWVVWSRYTGTNFDLAFARWDSRQSGWTPVAWLHPVVRPGDDLDPTLTFDADSRPYLAWWRNENGTGRVYLSLWLQTVWMGEYLVSDPEVDCSRPGISLLPDGRIQVQYDTPAGRVTRVLTFMRPWTITDDITPFGRFRVEATLTSPGRTF